MTDTRKPLGGQPSRAWVGLLAILILAGLPLLAAGAFGAPAAQTSHPAIYLPLVNGPPNYRIAFVSHQGVNPRIYVMNTNGSHQTNLVDGANPAWSPDGRQIAFDGVDVINADGTNRVYLQDGGDPDWSPDGTRIAFLSGGQIFTMRADGSDLVALTKQGPSNKGSPDWSPDGQWIAFVWGESLYAHGYDVCVKRANGSGSTRCLSRALSDGDEYNLAWSPDEQWLAFSSSYPFYEHSIYIVHPDGTGLTRLTTGDGTLAWSPDGRRIAFEQGGEIYAINVDGSSRVDLTTNPADDTNPVWSPDGRRIAFISNRDGNKEIYVMSADGSNQTNLSNNPADDTDPVWSPTSN